MDIFGRKNKENQQASISPQEIENAGVPTVNRQRSGGKLLTNIGYFLIVALGLALIVYVNSPKEPKAKKKNTQEEQVSNTLPPLVIPATPKPTVLAPPPPPAPEPAQQATGAKATAQNHAKQPMDWSERKMTGSLLVSASGGSSQQAAPTPAQNQPALARVDGQQPNQAQNSNNGLAAKLEPTITQGVSASQLPDRNLLITKGTSLDCALETALDSTLPGLTTCRLTRDVYSDNGRVLLMDRGSQLVGEYQGGMKQGQARLFVLWTRLETPTGVIVSLNSPGTDALGRSGLDGWVDNHFIERFGAAIMMSMIQSSIQMAANSAQSGTTNYYGNASNDGGRVIEKILDSTINIPPTLIKNQGDHIQVMVARDLDFSGVYALQAK